MHPILMDLYARERCADMLRAAEQWRAARERQAALRQRAAPGDRAPRSEPLRRRLGWLLVTIGLRLAVGAPGQLPRT